MICSWQWLFIPAVGCFGIGVVLMLVQALKLPGADRSLNGGEGVLLIVLLAAAVVSPIAFGFAKTPRIYK
jgi:hypothetical protein